MIRSTAAALLFLSTAPLLAQQPQPPSPETQFQGEIQVRETGLVVEPPDGAFKPTDLLVFEAGEPRQVLKAEPLRPDDRSRPWSVVLYFDRGLAGPEATHGAALALARQARRLTGLGTVEVAVADPEPRVTLAATADASALSTELGRIAELTRPRRGVPPADNRAPAAADLRRQLERLTAFLAGRSAPGARALFLAVDGFVPPPYEAGLLSVPEAQPLPPGTTAAALREASRSLAAGGWITFAVPFRDTAPTREERALADMERIRVQSGGSGHTNSAPPVIPMRHVDRGPLRHESVTEVFTRPDNAPWMALTQPTAGTVLGVEAQFSSAIDNLGRRWRVWYQRPESSDGKLRPVEVRLPNATAPLRSPRWVK